MSAAHDKSHISKGKFSTGRIRIEFYIFNSFLFLSTRLWQPRMPKHQKQLQWMEARCWKSNLSIQLCGMYRWMVPAKMKSRRNIACCANKTINSTGIYQKYWLLVLRRVELGHYLSLYACIQTCVLQAVKYTFSIGTMAAVCTGTEIICR